MEMHCCQLVRAKKQAENTGVNGDRRGESLAAAAVKDLRPIAAIPLSSARSLRLLISPLLLPSPPHSQLAALSARHGLTKSKFST